MRRLQNKRALVTGSSRGIGRQIAIGLAREGCNLIVHGRKAESTEETVQALSHFNVAVDTVYGELSSGDEVEKIIRTVGERYGGVDILYNNAAIQNEWKEIWDITMAEWLESFQINLFSMIRLCTAFAPGMRERGYGRIVNLTSGIQDIPQLAPYSVTKAAVDKYSRDLAAELRGSGVLVNYLDPGWLRTDLGGPQGMFEVETVIPGAIIPVLFGNDGPSGQFFSAQDYRSFPLWEE